MAKRKSAIDRVAGRATFIQASRSVSSEQKAIWHHVTGAGRSQVLRQFFGSTEAEIDDIRLRLERLIADRLPT